jgi:hypothetical protein
MPCCKACGKRYGVNDYEVAFFRGRDSYFVEDFRIFQNNFVKACCAAQIPPPIASLRSMTVVFMPFLAR